VIRSNHPVPPANSGGEVQRSKAIEDPGSFVPRV
jgi:hypothetical protein